MIDANERSEPDFAAFIGIDWADQRHAWVLRTTHSAVHVQFRRTKAFEESDFCSRNVGNSKRSTSAHFKCHTRPIRSGTLTFNNLVRGGSRGAE